MQLTTDGHKGYLSAVEGAFGIHVDYAMLVKLYGGQNLTMRMHLRRFTRLTNARNLRYSASVRYRT